MRNQRAFKEPTESEIDQIAEWLRPDTYEAVLEGIRRPRPEGSTVSRKPFELVWVLRPDRSIANVDRAKFGLVNDMTVGARSLGVGFVPDGKTLCVANGLESCYGPLGTIITVGKGRRECLPACYNCQLSRYRLALKFAL